MATLKKVKLNNEKELHAIIEKELDALEEGLELLKYEFGMEKGVPDFLCMDSGGRLVIIEVKLQEDENILFQALRYYSVIDKQRYVIAKVFSDKEIDPTKHPRMLLIAEKLSDDIRRLSTLIVPDVELYEYTTLLTPNKKHGICYHPVSLPKIEEIPSKPVTIQNLREYMTKDTLKPLFDEAIEKIKNIGKGIKEYTTQNYVGFKYKGRQIAWLSPQRKSFDVGVVVIDENARVVDYESKRIEIGDEGYYNIYEKIGKSFENISLLGL
ncbi:MAG: endonuclease NucS [Omnitrophica bacterium]|nr:endonuclease NucS [Candidatus Omnitrophota bacterium]